LKMVERSTGRAINNIDLIEQMKIEFLIKLQTQDYIAAQDIQKELLKLCPKDPTIR